MYIENHKNKSKLLSKQMPQSINLRRYFSLAYVLCIFISVVFVLFPSSLYPMQSSFSAHLSSPPPFSLTLSSSLQISFPFSPSPPSPDALPMSFPFQSRPKSPHKMKQPYHTIPNTHANTQIHFNFIMIIINFGVAVWK